MKTRLSTRKLVSLVALTITLFVFGALHISAPIQAAPSEQRATPTYTAEPTDTPEPTEAPTDTPEPTLPPTASQEPTAPAATNTPETPTEEPQNPTPTFTPTPTSDNDGNGDDDGSSDDGAVGDDPSACLARVEGFVVNAAGAGIAGTPVTLSGTGWSTTWTTDSNGFFYFEGVCAGTVTVSSTINGQTIARNVRATGRANSITEITLRPGGQQPAQPTATTVPTGGQQPAPQPSATPQLVQRLPQTGSTTSQFLIVALLLAGIMIGVRLVRARAAQ